MQAHWGYTRTVSRLLGFLQKIQSDWQYILRVASSHLQFLPEERLFPIFISAYSSRFSNFGRIPTRFLRQSSGRSELPLFEQGCPQSSRWWLQWDFPVVRIAPLKRSSRRGWLHWRLLGAGGGLVFLLGPFERHLVERLYLNLLAMSWLLCTSLRPSFSFYPAINWSFLPHFPTWNHAASSGVPS